jgi:aconitate hydratase
VNAGGMGALYFGAGGYDIALAMASGEYQLPMPKVVRIDLTGQLPDGVMAMDVILKMLSMFGVNGGKGKVFEYGGPGVVSLSVPERATITNMGAEMGASTSIFPSDERTREYLESRGRGADYQPLAADEGATYADQREIDLSSLEPLIALYPSPGNVEPVSKHLGTKVQQICVGSCTNSSFENIASFAELLKGKRVAVDTLLYPGSRAVAIQLTNAGYITSLWQSGVRVMENGCGACIGQGGSPPSKGISLRTFNRNFPKRSGTPDASVHLVSPLVAAASALTGVVSVPEHKVVINQVPQVDDRASFLMPPSAEEAEKISIIRGPNIMAIPDFEPLPAKLEGEVLLKLGDNISTDDIQPAGKYLPLRSNVKAYAMQATFNLVDNTFSKRAVAHRDAGGHGILVGRDNYGQGSSREHAALCPRWLGIRAVIVAQFARIHVANLVNFGIVPLTFKNVADYDKIKQGDKVVVDVANLEGELSMEVNGERIPLVAAFEPKDVPVLKLGGALPQYKALHAG